MTQLEFILQPKEEQLEIIDTFGFEVAKKNDKKHASVFYCVDSFFVEVKFRNEALKQIRAFNDPTQIYSAII